MDIVPDKTANGALFGAWLRVFTWETIIPAFPKVIQIAFTYTQPFLVKQGIALAGMPEIQPYNNIGYGLIGAYAIVYTGIAVSLLPSRSLKINTKACRYPPANTNGWSTAQAP